jgi:cytochrome oxidase Cu insertion factor (SCO1/SenC/PrrC family)
MGYLMNHTTSYLAVDPDGKLRLIIAHGTDPEIVAEDLRHVL